MSKQEALKQVFVMLNQRAWEGGFLPEQIEAMNQLFGELSSDTKAFVRTLSDVYKYIEE